MRKFKEWVKKGEPIDHMISAFFQEADMFDREGKTQKAEQYRSMAKRMEHNKKSFKNPE